MSCWNEDSKHHKLLPEGLSDSVLHFKKKEFSIGIGAFALKSETRRSVLLRSVYAHFELGCGNVRLFSGFQRFGWNISRGNKHVATLSRQALAMALSRDLRFPLRSFTSLHVI